MAYADARAAIVSIFTGTTPTLAPSTKYVELRDLRLDGSDRPGDRHFVVESDAMEVPTPLSGTRKERRAVAVTVFYRRTARVAEQDLLLASDANDIEERLLDVANWNRTTSTIHSIADDGGQRILSVVVEKDAEMVRQIVSFPVLYVA